MLNQSNFQKWKKWNPKEISNTDTKKINKNKKPSTEKKLFKDSIFKKNLKKINKPFDELSKTNYDRGFKDGKILGHQLAHKELSEIIKKKKKGLEQLNSLLKSLYSSISILDSKISSHVVHTILKIVKKILGKNPSLNNNSMIKKIKYAIRTELQEYINLRFYINIHEADFIKKHFKSYIKNYKWEIISNENISIGECKIVHKKGSILISAKKSWKELQKNLSLKENKCSLN